MHRGTGSCGQCGYRGIRKPKDLSKKAAISRVHRVFKYRAGTRGLKFDLSKKYLEESFNRQNGRCALSGVKITLGDGINDRSASIDRIDSNKDYTKDNIQWVHKIVNKLKGTLNQNDFTEWCRRITESTANRAPDNRTVCEGRGMAGGDTGSVPVSGAT